MQNKFQNLKIAINDEVHLKAVCDVLESMGYKNEQFEFPIINHRGASNFKTITCYKSGDYRAFNLSADWINFCELATLTDLLKMRDDAFMGAIR